MKVQNKAKLKLKAEVGRRWWGGGGGGWEISPKNILQQPKQMKNGIHRRDFTIMARLDLVS